MSADASFDYELHGYRDFERHAYEETCNLFKGVKTDA